MLTPAERRWCAVAFLASLLTHGLPAVISGVRAAPDTSTYSMWADRLIAMHFNYPRYLSATEYWNVPPVLYAFFVTIVAISKQVAGQSWQQLIFVLQIIADCATAAVVAALAVRFGSARAAVAAIAFYAAGFDIA